jgi:hypothetical protein
VCERKVRERKVRERKVRERGKDEKEEETYFECSSTNEFKNAPKPSILLLTRSSEAKGGGKGARENCLGGMMFFAGWARPSFSN